MGERCPGGSDDEETQSGAREGVGRVERLRTVLRTLSGSLNGDQEGAGGWSQVGRGPATLPPGSRRAGRRRVAAGTLSENWGTGAIVVSQRQQEASTRVPNPSRAASVPQRPLPPPLGPRHHPAHSPSRRADSSTDRQSSCRREDRARRPAERTCGRVSEGARESGRRVDTSRRTGSSPSSFSSFSECLSASRHANVVRRSPRW